MQHTFFTPLYLEVRTNDKDLLEDKIINFSTSINKITKTVPMALLQKTTYTCTWWAGGPVDPIGHALSLPPSLSLHALCPPYLFASLSLMPATYVHALTVSLSPLSLPVLSLQRALSPASGRRARPARGGHGRAGGELRAWPAGAAGAQASCGRATCCGRGRRVASAVGGRRARQARAAGRRGELQAWPLCRLEGWAAPSHHHGHGPRPPPPRGRPRHAGRASTTPPESASSSPRWSGYVCLCYPSYPIPSQCKLYDFASSLLHGAVINASV